MRAHRGPHQPQRRQAYRGGHAPHLAVASFAQGDRQPGVGHGLAEPHRRIAWPQRRRRLQQLHPRRQRRPVIEQHPVAQRLQHVPGRHALHLHPIGLVLLVARIGQAMRQATVVGEQQQAFAVVVQAPCRIHVPGQAETGQRRPRRLAAIGELAQHVEGFVEGDEHGGGAER